MPERALALNAAELRAFLAEVFPEVDGRFEIEALAPMRARVRILVRDDDLRPGGTVSGPTMFMAADLAFYVAVLAMIGREPLTVTTNLAIDFMRKPAPTDLIAEARILKLGRTLAVGDVVIASAGAPQSVAHANVTYAVPAKPSPEAPPASSQPPEPGLAARFSNRDRPRPPRPRRRKVG